jgi:two-component system, LytTR family, response regulator
MKNEKITVLIVDDDKKSQEVLAHHLGTISDIFILGVASGADEAYRFLLETVPDLIFLDVEMPGKSGFDLLADIRKLNINPGIIFQTAFDKYAIQAIKSAAFDYLLKPIDKAELLESLVKFRNSRNHHNLEEKVEHLIKQIRPVEKIRLNTRSGFIMIDPTDIVYCKADWSYTEIYLSDGKMIVVSMNMGKVMDLLDSTRFFRINRSMILNLSKISSVNRKNHKCVIICNDVETTFNFPARQLRVLDDLAK